MTDMIDSDARKDLINRLCEYADCRPSDAEAVIDWLKNGGGSAAQNTIVMQPDGTFRWCD